MAGPEPRDTYSSVPTAEPQTQTENDLLSTRAAPTDFGAQVGQAVEKTGQVAGQIGNQVMDYAIQAQGLANEHAANMADMSLAVDGGKIYDQYKQLEGLDAAAAKDKAVSDYLQLNTKIRDNLGNPAAKRAYDQIAVRRMSYTIQDMNSYAADQTKSAYRLGRTASMNNNIEQANRPEVAGDPKQFGNVLGGIKFDAAALYTDPTYGKYRGASATMDTKTGLLKFNDSAEGKIAQDDYDTYVNKAVGLAWKNRITTLATDPKTGNVVTAVNVLTENKDNIPADTYAELSRGLSGPYKNEQAREGADTFIGKFGNASPDFLRSNYAEIMKQADTDAESQRPNDATYKDQYVARVEQRVNNVIRGQELALRADQDTVIGAMFDKNGQPAVSDISQIEQSQDPNVRRAWLNYQSNNSYGATTLVNRLSTANSRGMALGNGTQFYQHLQSVLTGQVSDPTTFGPAIGDTKDAPLTNTGFTVLDKTIKNHNTPENSAFDAAESAYLKRLHSQYTGAGQVPGISDTQTNSEFNKALEEILPQIQAGRSRGLTAAKMFTPGSSDYITSSVKAPSMSSLFDGAISAGLSNNTATPDGYKSLSDLQTAVKTGKINKKVAVDYALKQKWIQPDPPQVPLPQ